MKKFSLLMATCVVASIAIGQKLPNKQTAGLRAAADIKVDGKIADDYPFQAYNSATEVFYSLANDDANLYLTVRSGSAAAARRIFNGGLTFTISATLKKTAESVSVGYPFYESGKRMMLLRTVMQDGKSVVATGKVKDSLVKVNSDQLAAKAKFIKVAGIASVDTLISVYNTDGIKAVGGLDKDLNYVYELAIPLKYLKGLITAEQKFAYELKINEVIRSATITTTDPLDHSVTERIVPGGSAGQPATNFAAEYVLVGKP